VAAASAAVAAASAAAAVASATVASVAAAAAAVAMAAAPAVAMAAAPAAVPPVFAAVAAGAPGAAALPPPQTWQPRDHRNDRTDRRKECQNAHQCQSAAHELKLASVRQHPLLLTWFTMLAPLP
jgi:hypothetical protein